jgi:thiamine biosynthesis lipoprotein
LLLSAVLLAVAAPFSARERRLERFDYSLPRMGTLFRIELYAPEENAAAAAAMAAFDRIEKLEQLLSDFREDSELSLLTRQAVGAPMRVSPELFEVLERSLEISRLSDGAFDVTIGPVSQLWRRARHEGRPPDPAELAKARKLVDYRLVELDSRARTVMFRESGMQLDLGAIGKGYAADEALRVLESRGIHRALIDAGGDLRLGDPPPERAGWRVELFDPGGSAAPCVLTLRGVGVATSGDAFQRLERNDERYSHIVNPRDAQGVRDAASVTVIAADGTTADALSTTLSILPVEEGVRLLESFPGASAYLVRRSADGFRRHASRGFPASCGRQPRQGM